MNYFYLCSYPLEVGSIILSGNWGRILQLYPLANQNNWWLLFRESTFENIRLKEFPKLPSRFESAFLCESLKDIIDFKDKTGRAFDLVYEVELLDQNALMHRGCLSVFDQEREGNIKTLEEKARKYWESSNVQRPELVTTSRIRVISQNK